MKKLFLFSAALLAASSLYAVTVYCRSGAVLCAEFSRRKPYDFKSFGTEEPIRDPVYAAVTIKLDKGRKIGVSDYSLKVGGRSYECVAVRDNSSERFLELADGGSKRRCTLFFELDASAAGKGGRAVLVCNAPGGGSVALTVVNRGGRAFTSDSAIPEPGAAKPAK